MLETPSIPEFVADRWLVCPASAFYSLAFCELMPVIFTKLAAGLPRGEVHTLRYACLACVEPIPPNYSF